MTIVKKMFNLLPRILNTRSSHATAAVRFFCQKIKPVRQQRIGTQIDYLKSINDSNALDQDWNTVKKTVLSMQGNINQKNADAIILKVLVQSNNLVAASLLAQHLKAQELSLGSINSILLMYSAMGKEKSLTKEQKQFILDTYNSLYDKYKILDSSTCEQLLHALCTVSESEKALRVLNDIHMSSVPTHSAYSTVIATFLKLNKKKKALEIIEESVKYNRPLQDVAYDEWLNYILRKYKDKKVIAKHIDEILKHIDNNWALISENTANRFKNVYNSLDWESQFVKIRKGDGQCSYCKEKLDCLLLSNEEFGTLQQVVKEKLIVGSDLLLKTTHDELKRFLDLMEHSSPYDIVLDGLNICYTLGNSPHLLKLQLLNNIIDHFKRENKKILLLGRQHMLRWNNKFLEKIMRKTSYFFTENISQDDPFFITAAILSGPNTDIVSKDLLRGHKFNLKDKNLIQLFKRWQWQHQWMVFMSKQEGPNIQAPLKFTPCAQKKNSTWHIPYVSETVVSYGAVNDGVPDLRHWLCLRQK